MNKFFYTFIAFLLFTHLLSFSQSKQALKHSVYDTWSDIKAVKIHPNSNYISYSKSPQIGDSKLVILDVQDFTKIEVDRGENLVWDYKADFFAFKVVPEYDTIRKCKIANIKEKDYPEDSLYIWFPKTNKLSKIPSVKSYKCPKKFSGWIAYNHYPEKPVKDTTDKSDIDSTNAKDTTPKIEYKGGKLVIHNTLSGNISEVLYCDEYVWAEENPSLIYTTHYKNQLDSVELVWMNGNNLSYTTLLKTAGEIKNISLNKKGDKLAFIHSADTCKNKHYQLFYFDLPKLSKFEITDSITKAIPQNWVCSEHAKIWFADNDKYLFFGTSPKLPKEQPDTIPEDEIAVLDVWSYTDDLLQSDQLKNLEKEQKRSYTAVYHINNNFWVQLADSSMETLHTGFKGNPQTALGYTTRPYNKLISWESSNYRDYFIVDLSSGKRNLICEKCYPYLYSSLDMEKFVYYNPKDSTWYSLNNKDNQWYEIINSSEIAFFNQDYDNPGLPGPYGIGGFTYNSQSVLIYDKYDIWEIDLKNTSNIVNITYGRNQNKTYRYVKLDKEQEYININEGIVLSVFDNITKASGYSFFDYDSGLNSIIYENKSITGLSKAEESDNYIFRKSDYKNYPDVYYSNNLRLNNSTKITNAGDQNKDYYWGNVKLYSWTSASGDSLSGLLYTPDNFDPNNKYPMIVYFYERYSDQLHAHYSPRPSRSVINFPYYTSNGYIIFIPDIPYKIGKPGKSAVEAVVSGTLSLVEKGFIDKNKIGLQGQSWGGYQVAYIITQTDLFACAMAGAPVSNMTSAYGGIRWSSGKSRMMQYEDGQSRIGESMWDNLNAYIENSPVFYANKVNTPLLIMHNDNDGAVPWQQGLEFFLALRRLEKPVWLLSYNGDEHNLKQRANCKDLSIRMQQFFDYYLKDDYIPVWMSKGIPATYKNKNYGLELIKH
ncbi:MAG: prolyl oligopeptidase family serine peptidase [Bacteroidales bacterium]|nr:prolyl oligopeptidase family serine peptidase [Bacteroidales bacterium]